MALQPNGHPSTRQGPGTKILGKKLRRSFTSSWWYCSFPALLVGFALLCFASMYQEGFPRLASSRKKLLGTSLPGSNFELELLEFEESIAGSSARARVTQGALWPFKGPSLASLLPSLFRHKSSRLEEYPKEVQEAATKLYKTWSEVYGLTSTYTPPRDLFSIHNHSRHSVWAPHLEECVAAESRHRKAEEHPGTGGYPAWACAKDNGTGIEACDYPRPPWVHGADEDNLPLTRVVQRDLWLRQFPRNCADPTLRFLIVEWPNGAYGIGSQLHLMAIAFSLAVVNHRILVFAPGSYTRAIHDDCKAMGKNGTLECYFFPVTSPECARQAQKLHKKAWGRVDFLKAKERAASKDRVVCLAHNAYHFWGESADRVWGEPWKGTTFNFALLGSITESFEPNYKAMSWWRSQAVRFMLRWPTAYLCHLTNIARHEAYGMGVALQLAAEEAAEKQLEQSKLRRPETDWLAESRARPNRTALEELDSWRFAKEPYVPRPIISMHVRQGDKGEEMNIYSLPSYMMMAHRVRRFVPNVKNIWLSTEMQTVIDDLWRYPDWKFFFTPVKRQVGTKTFVTYEEESGLAKIVATSFTNLIISSQCDMFVGVLASNWNRLINELRMTNGRLKSNYFALNFDDYR